MIPAERRKPSDTPRRVPAPRPVFRRALSAPRVTKGDLFEMWISRSWHEQNMGKYGKYMGHGRTIKGILVLLASISLYVKLFFLVHSSLVKTAITPMCQPYFLGTLPHTSPASPRSWHSLEYQVQKIKTPFSLREHVKTRSYPHCLTLFLLLKSPVSWYVCYSTV